MREIKFRAWDGKTLFQVNPVWFEEMGIYQHDDFQRCASELNCVLMQFTGLKDKKGREIYEGDIISYDASDGEDDWISKDVVHWSECYGWELKEIMEPVYDWMKEIEIIGNIYENPELLK